MPTLAPPAHDPRRKAGRELRFAERVAGVPWNARVAVGLASAGMGLPAFLFLSASVPGPLAQILKWSEAWKWAVWGGGMFLFASAPLALVMPRRRSFRKYPRQVLSAWQAAVKTYDRSMQKKLAG